MNKPIDQDFFERVFSDAHVIDVDLSRWSKKVSLWVLADHLEEWTYRCPLVITEFNFVRNFSFEFLECGLAKELAELHIQWRIDDFEIGNDKFGNFAFRLWGSKSSPTLCINCESISFRRSNPEILDQLFPGWNTPNSGLIERGIEQLWEENSKRT
jgi:hypothetical protein